VNILSSDVLKTILNLEIDDIRRIRKKKTAERKKKERNRIIIDHRTIQWNNNDT